MLPIDTTLKDSLASLGFSPDNYRVLMLLPLVYVAWADGYMDDAEIARIDDIAKTRFHLGPKGLAILDSWLFERPSKEYFGEGMRDLFYLAQSEDGEPLVHPEELHDLLVHCESIARASGHALDVPTGVTKEEEDALVEIARILGVDNGVSWGRLLDELDAGPASVEAGRGPGSRRHPQ